MAQNRVGDCLNVFRSDMAASVQRRAGTVLSVLVPNERGLEGALWGFGAETGLHALAIIRSGAFDRFPKLRMVVGHLGEALPFWADRLDNRFEWEFASSGRQKPMKRLPSEYLRDHFHITTSGMNYWPQLKLTIDLMGSAPTLVACLPRMIPVLEGAQTGACDQTLRNQVDFFAKASRLGVRTPV